MSAPVQTLRPSSSPEEAQALQEAMDWLVRLHEPKVCDTDLVEWTVWYEADARHQQAFEQMQHLWIRAGALAEGPEGLARIERLLGPPRESDARRRHAGPRIALAASAAAAAVGLAWLSHRVFHARPPASAAAAPLVRQMALPDGTSVEVAPGTRIVVRYTAARRRVALLSGEAYFSVHHDASRPFLVTVNGLTVRDVGTAFNVRKAGSRADVTVVRGEIEVSPGSGAARGHTGVRVGAGEEVKWGRRTRPVVQRTDTGRALAWRQGRLEYIDEPLSAVIADVDRYARQPVVIRDGAAGRIAFTGTVFARYADQWVRALPGEFPVRLVSGPGHSLVLESRTDERP